MLVDVVQDTTLQTKAEGQWPGRRQTVPQGAAKHAPSKAGGGAAAFLDSLVVALGVVWARDWQSFVVSALLVIVAFLITSIANYGIGRHGIYQILLNEASLNKNRAWVSRGIPWATWVSNFHPNLGALTAASRGILCCPFLAFVARSGAALTV